MDAGKISYAILARIHHMIPAGAIAAVEIVVKDEVCKGVMGELTYDLVPRQKHSPLAVALLEAVKVADDPAKVKKIVGEALARAKEEAGK